MRHPGRILLDEYELARALEVPPRRINEIVLGKRAITADTALRLEALTGMAAMYWLGLQAEYDLDQARLPKALRDRKLPAPRRTRAQRRMDAFSYQRMEGVDLDDTG